jgi:hypothetical protein
MVALLNLKFSEEEEEWVTLKKLDFKEELS